MPQVVTKLEQHKVNAVLRARGWAFNRQAGIGLRLTKQDDKNPAFKSTGKKRRILMTPISRAHLDEILSYSRNIQEAVEQIEAISIGAQLAPQFAHPGANSPAPGMDPQVMEKLLTQRMENEISKVTERMQAETQSKLDAAAEKLAALEAKLAEAEAMPPTPQENANKRASKAKGKKASKKATTRKQPKGGILDRIKQQKLDENGDPVLTPEQEADYAKAMGAAAKQD